MIAEKTGEIWSLYPDRFMAIVYNIPPEPMLPGTYKDLKAGKIEMGKPEIKDFRCSFRSLKEIIEVCTNPMFSGHPLLPPPHVGFEFMKLSKAKDLADLKPDLRWGSLKSIEPGSEGYAWVLKLKSKTLIGVATWSTQ
jgi:hypothetical protein